MLVTYFNSPHFFLFPHKLFSKDVLVLLIKLFILSLFASLSFFSVFDVLFLSVFVKQHHHHQQQKQQQTIKTTTTQKRLQGLLYWPTRRRRRRTTTTTNNNNNNNNNNKNNNNNTDNSILTPCFVYAYCLNRQVRLFHAFVQRQLDQSRNGDPCQWEATCRWPSLSGESGEICSYSSAKGKHLHCCS